MQPTTLETRPTQVTHIDPHVGGPASSGDLLLIRNPKIRGLSIRKALGFHHPPVLILGNNRGKGLNVTDWLARPNAEERRDITCFTERIERGLKNIHRDSDITVDGWVPALSMRFFVDEKSEIYTKPSWEAVRKALMRDKCHVEGCENGLVERVATYATYPGIEGELGEIAAALLGAGVYDGKMLCPDCHGIAIVLEDERLEAMLLDWQWPKERREEHAKAVSRQRQELGYTTFPIGRAVHVTDFQRAGAERAIAIFPLHRTGDPGGSWHTALPLRWEFDRPAYQVRGRPVPLVKWLELEKGSVSWFRGRKVLDRDCTICLERLADEAGQEILVELPACKHTFHERCIGDWVARRDTCPTCRVKV